MHAETDVLVIGSGAAGMYAPIEAARAGCQVLLADRSLIGRGGATVMAQMTVAVALGSETPDHWSHHYQDTLTAGRGLCIEPLAQLLCEDGTDRIRAMDEWGVGWARKDGCITQAMAPGHDRPRCVYVDFLNTGPAVSKTLRTVVNKTGGIRKVGDLCVFDLLQTNSEISGAVALHLGSGAPVKLSAKATILSTGGLPQKRYAGLKDGTYRVVTVMEPFISLGLKDGAHIIAASFYRGGEVISPDLSAEQRKDYYAAENKAVDLINADFYKYAHHVATATKGALKPNELLRAFVRYKHVDYYDSTLFGRTYEWMKARGLTEGQSEHSALVVG